MSGARGTTLPSKRSLLASLLVVLLAGTQTHSDWFLKTPYPRFPFRECVLPPFLSGTLWVQGLGRVVFCWLCCEPAGGALCKVEVAGLWLSRGGRGVEPHTLQSDCTTEEVTVPMVSVGIIHLVAGHTHMANCTIIVWLICIYSRAGMEARPLCLLGKRSAPALWISICKAHQKGAEELVM